MLRTLLAVLGLAIATSGSAAAEIPCTTVTVVAPFPPGSNTDSVARVIGEKVSEILGKSLVIENKPGAEGQIAAMDVKRAPPDGCRIFFSTSGNLSILPYIRKNPPFDPLKDFTPIAGVGRYTYILYVSPAVPGRTVQDFIAYAKSSPGKFNYATGSNTNLLVFSQIQKQFGLQMERISYKGEPPAILDLIQDRVQAIVATTIGVPYAKDNRIRALAVMSRQRNHLLPDVPTFEEAGIKHLAIVPWAGIVGPAGMPEQIVEKLSSAFLAAMSRADVQARATALGFTLEPSTFSSFASLIREQHQVYGQVIADVGLPAQ